MAERKTVPVRIKPISRAKHPEKFLQLLREENRQRVKSRSEKFREEIVSGNPEESYRALLAHRDSESCVIADAIDIRGKKHRAEISEAKFSFLDAVIDILNSRRKFWPLSDRSIHYPLLNKPPLIHASKPRSTYTNTQKSYRALIDLLTRARLESYIPMHAIADTTRPVVVWNVNADPQVFVRGQVDKFLKHYRRDLQQSQPHHIEILGEKNTLAPILRPVASRYNIPLTLGRGYCSLPPRYEMAERFEKSGKDQLILLILSDFDPDGEEIAHSFARSMRDDFGIDKITAVKVALTVDQVDEYQLPPMMKAKKGSAHYERFTSEYGDDVFELEALEPETLQMILADAIDSVIDTDAFNHEIDEEKGDAAFLDGVRKMVYDALAEIDFDEEGDG